MTLDEKKLDFTNFFRRVSWHNEFFDLTKTRFNEKCIWSLVLRYMEFCLYLHEDRERAVSLSVWLQTKHFNAASMFEIL